MKKVLIIHISGNGDSEQNNIGNFSFAVANEIEKLNKIPFPFVMSSDEAVTGLQKAFKEREGITIPFEKMKKVVDALEREDGIKSEYCARKIKEKAADKDELLVLLYGDLNGGRIKDILNGEYAVMVKEVGFDNPEACRSKVLFHVKNGMKALRKEPRKFKKITL